MVKEEFCSSFWTEPLVRVMVEAATDADAERYAQSIADVVEDKMGLDK